MPTDYGHKMNTATHGKSPDILAISQLSSGFFPRKSPSGIAHRHCSLLLWPRLNTLINTEQHARTHTTRGWKRSYHFHFPFEWDAKRDRRQRNAFDHLGKFQLSPKTIRWDSNQRFDQERRSAFSAAIGTYFWDFEIKRTMVHSDKFGWIRTKLGNFGQIWEN